jgi:hypothetical protein
MVDDDEDGDGDTNETDLLPTAPPPATLQAIRESYPKIERRARRYAEHRVRLVRITGRAVPQHYARELLDDAFADTWCGRVTWVPERCDLLLHLRGVIYDRTWAEIRRAARHPHFSIDAPANDRAWTVDRLEVEHALADSSEAGRPSLVVSALFASVCDELRRLASEDRDALAVLWCWQQSITDRHEVMSITGLEKTEYQRARKRLLYLSRDLPPELREAAQDQLRSAS